MGEIRISVDGKKVIIHADMSKKELLEILKKANIEVHKSIIKEKEDEFTGTRWINTDDESPRYHQEFTITAVRNENIYLKYDGEEGICSCGIDDLTEKARITDE